MAAAEGPGRTAGLNTLLPAPPSAPKVT